MFFNLFFEVEPFAAILIADGTHGRSREICLSGTVKFEAEGQVREQVLGEGAES